MTPTNDALMTGIERAKQRRAARDASGEVYVDGSIYDGMAACLVRSGQTIAHVVDYGDAVEIAAALASAPAAKTEWRCFHCGDVFTDERCARLHFGRDEDSEPACIIKAGAEQGLLSALREAEYAAADARHAIADESTDAAKAYYAQATRHDAALRNAEEAGYERGLADGRSFASAPAGDGVRAVPQTWIDRAMQIEGAADGLVSMVCDAIQRAQEGTGRLYAANIVQLDKWVEQVLEAINLPEPVFPADFTHLRPAADENDVGLVEAARDLLDAHKRLNDTVRYRFDLWECLEANLDRLAAQPSITKAEAE